MSEMDYMYYAQSIPCDEELLEPLGRVVWAAIRLQHTVRDFIGIVGGKLSGQPFDSTLGGAITTLRNAASALDHPDRQAIMDWCDGSGKQAKNARDSVLHAVGYTAEDGKQALSRHGRHGTERFTADHINLIAGILEHAAGELHEAGRGIRSSWN